MHPYHGCAYRAPKKQTCAIGCLFPDDLYVEDMEGKPADELLKKWPALLSYLGEDAALAVELQGVHDGSKFWQASGLAPLGVERLREVAFEFSLSPAVLTELWPATPE